LPYTQVQLDFTPDAGQAALLPPAMAIEIVGISAEEHALFLQNGVVPTGFQLLQLLNAEGSTQTVLGANLTIYSDFINFAINMQDTGDGWTTYGDYRYDSCWRPDAGGNLDWHGFNITIWERSHQLHAGPVCFG
jgi:hypothetical protein